ncbi:MAG: hypothetical protein KME09_23445 [Pleurocapsa minor HA4230-MV1]|jgi:hypothetical protein|nr:hypothetical protein [Pleurocapsa minor HA4230-MV1]
MPKFIIDILFAFSGMFLTSYFFYSSTNWKELSDKYSCKKNSSIFVYVVEERACINKMALNGLNIGVSQEGLFLKFPSLLGFVFSSILIPWDEISYGQNIDNNSRRDFVLNLGNPKIASLQLSSHTIEKINENYGEPIFFEQLGEPN